GGFALLAAIACVDGPSPVLAHINLELGDSQHDVTCCLACPIPRPKPTFAQQTRLRACWLQQTPPARDINTKKPYRRPVRLLDVGVFGLESGRQSGFCLLLAAEPFETLVEFSQLTARVDQTMHTGPGRVALRVDF